MHHTKCVSPTGAALPVHVPLRRVHWHGNHLQHHPPSGHRASDNAHAEVLLLGGQPCREQLHHSQGSRWVATLGRCCICFSRRRWILQKPQIPSWLCLFSGWLKPAPIRREGGWGGSPGNWAITFAVCGCESAEHPPRRGELTPTLEYRGANLSAVWMAATVAGCSEADVPHQYQSPTSRCSAWHPGPRPRLADSMIQSAIRHAVREMKVPLNCRSRYNHSITLSL